MFFKKEDGEGCWGNKAENNSGKNWNGRNSRFFSEDGRKGDPE